ncbi:Uncharacterized protein conserved in bacteria [Helicobacter mustelae]|uniref:pimeloyl-ACP methyl esterase BioG family protein n=1 Tax=Helicobacter mustelae TaxID=217 RepID=UPI000E05E8F0|nr:pimeloyl-ACP methyl esterase BioG family protein [Helicobacter mustelae]STP12516.1 Uncharacterized protein conserved in bacteria [Helicobacter mustelae]
MQVTILHPITTKRVTLCFGGFGTDPSFFGHLHAQCGVVLVYDYREDALNLDFLEGKEIFLLAWSMGVAMANRFTPPTLHIKKSIAINGTDYGIHKTFGIPPRIFAHTIKHFSPLDFYQGVFGWHFPKARDFTFPTNLTEELSWLYHTLCTIPPRSFAWDDVYISQEDAIFASKIQKSTWEHYKILQAPHFVFFDVQRWEDFFEA